MAARALPPALVAACCCTMRADEAIAAAAAEGLTLARKEGTPFGFWGVSRSGPGKFKAQVRGLPGAGAKSNSNPKALGARFESPEEAALALARKYPSAASKLVELEAVKATKAAVSMTEEEVKLAARAEGLTLLLSSTVATGYHGVAKKADCKSRPYRAQLPGRSNRKQGSGGDLGRFASAHEAALAIARKLGPDMSAEMARPRRNGWVLVESRELSSSEATRIAEEEGLSLRRKYKSDSYWGVYQRPGTPESTPRWLATIYVGRGHSREYKTDKAMGEDSAGASSSGRAESFPGGAFRSPADRELRAQHQTWVEKALRKGGVLNLGSHASSEAAALTIARLLRNDQKLMAIVTKVQKKARETQHSAISSAAGKRKRVEPIDEECEDEESDDYSCDDDSDNDICEDESDDDIVAVTAVECWSDDEDDALHVTVQVVNSM